MVHISGCFSLLIKHSSLPYQDNGFIHCVIQVIILSLLVLNFQASVGEMYPALDVTVVVFFQTLFSTVQCGVFALFTVRDLSEWKLNWGIGFIGILYQVLNELYFVFFIVILTHDQLMIKVMVLYDKYLIQKSVNFYR